MDFLLIQMNDTFANLDKPQTCSSKKTGFRQAGKKDKKDLSCSLYIYQQDLGGAYALKNFVTAHEYVMNIETMFLLRVRS
jgi:hypothetical protein